VERFPRPLSSATLQRVRAGIGRDGHGVVARKVFIRVARIQNLG
jgi:hypothetical protein